MNEYLKDQNLYFYFKKIFEPSTRHFSQVSKSRISKNLKFRRKANCDFRGNLIENHFRHLKAYRLEAFLMWAPFERQKSIFQVLLRGTSLTNRYFNLY